MGLLGSLQDTLTGGLAGGALGSAGAAAATAGAAAGGVTSTFKGIATSFDDKDEQRYHEQRKKLHDASDSHNRNEYEFEQIKLEIDRLEELSGWKPMSLLKRLMRKISPNNSKGKATKEVIDDLSEFAGEQYTNRHHRADYVLTHLFDKLIALADNQTLLNKVRYGRDGVKDSEEFKALVDGAAQWAGALDPKTQEALIVKWWEKVNSPDSSWMPFMEIKLPESVVQSISNALRPKLQELGYVINGAKIFKQAKPNNDPNAFARNPAASRDLASQLAAAA